jgi:dCTP deaminase
MVIKLISYGVSSYGYDVRCSNEFKVFTNIHSAVVDPKSLMQRVLWIFNLMYVLFPLILLPLARTVEYFQNTQKCAYHLSWKVYLCKMWDYC